MTKGHRTGYYQERKFLSHGTCVINAIKNHGVVSLPMQSLAGKAIAYPLAIQHWEFERLNAYEVYLGIPFVTLTLLTLPK